MKIRALTAAIIFIALTAVKLIFPNAISNAKKVVESRMVSGESIASYALSLGRRVTGQEDAIYAWEDRQTSQMEISPEPTPENAPSPSPEASATAEDFDLDSMVNSNLSGFQQFSDIGRIPTESELPEASAALPEESAAMPEETPIDKTAELAGLIDGFIAAQAMVTDLAFPERVCLEPVILDLDYASPIPLETTSVFGYREHPIHKDIRFHYGTDFDAATGDPIGAFANGTVIAAQEFSGYGLTVMIDHGNGITSLYAHCSSIAVSYGDTVEKGQTIARVGATGNVTGPHLHFELQKDGKYLNPEFYL